MTVAGISPLISALGQIFKNLFLYYNWNTLWSVGMEVFVQICNITITQFSVFFYKSVLKFTFI